MLLKQPKSLGPVLQLGTAALQVLTLGGLLSLSLSVHRLSKKPPPSLVQTTDGIPLRVLPVAAEQRTDETIRRFTSVAMYDLFNMRSEIIDAKGETIRDPGIEVETPDGKGKVTTPAMAASMALQADLRQPMLALLADLTPRGVFNGRQQVILVIDELSQPEELDKGIWQLTMLAHLNVMSQSGSLQDIIPFNRTIVVRATTPPLVPEGETPIEQAVYSIRQAGLEITDILELTPQTTSGDTP